MAETRAADVQFPPGRYGRRREGRKPSKWLVGGLTGLVVIAGIGVAVAMYQQYGRQDFTGDVLKFDTSHRSVKVLFEVHKPEGSQATCLVRARNKAGAEVGHAKVSIPAEGSHTKVNYTLETSARPVTGELLRCYPPQLDSASQGGTLAVWF